MYACVCLYVYTTTPQSTFWSLRVATTVCFHITPTDLVVLCTVHGTPSNITCIQRAHSNRDLTCTPHQTAYISQHYQLILIRSHGIGFLFKGDLGCNFL